ATIGQVGNIDHENRSIGKAGRSRHMGRRPSVRGSVMNPRDHPHGGGEGRAPIGGQPQTPWGKPALGYKTRRNKKTDQFIVRRRNAGRRRQHMSRSRKKGPYIHESLRKKVLAMMRSGDRRVVKHWSRAS